jgi:hypothetical protein
MVDLDETMFDLFQKPSLWAAFDQGDLDCRQIQHLLSD